MPTTLLASLFRLRRGFILLWMASSTRAIFADGSKYLYEDKEPPILEYTLTTNDFTSSEAPRIVEFYSPYCGGCRNFKPHYIELAKQVTAKHTNVEFYAVSCAAHKDMCTNYKIRGYPTLFAFSDGKSEGEYLKRDSKIKAGHTAESMLEALGIQSAEEDVEEVDDEEEDARNLDQNEEKEEEQFGDDEVDEEKEAGEEEDVEDEEEAGEDTKNVVAAFDGKTDANRGYAELTDETTVSAVDTPGFQVQVNSNRVRTGPGPGAQMSRTAPNEWNKFQDVMAQQRKELVKIRTNQKVLQAKERDRSFNIFGFAPEQVGSTKIMKANTPGTVEYEKRKEEIMKQVRNNRGRLPVRREHPAAEQIPFKKENLPMVKNLRKQNMLQRIAKLPVMKRLIKTHEEEYLYWDVAKSFSEGLRSGVYTSIGPLEEKRKVTLRTWLQLLSISLPPEWALHELVDELYANIDVVAQSENNMLRILDKHAVPRNGWSPACSNGKAGQGYSCGMWKLLHLMTIGMAEHRGGTHLVQSGFVDPSTRVFSPKDAAETVREYIAQFFACAECKKHFIAKYDDCSFRRCLRLSDKSDSTDPADWKQLALWMWEVHNEVNVRVGKHQRQQGRGFRLGVRNEQPNAEVRALWPSIGTCIVCFEEDGSWDEDSVFEFIEKTYWLGSLDPKKDRLLRYKGTDSQKSGGFLRFIFLIATVIAFLRLARRCIRIKSPYKNHLISTATVLGRSALGTRKTRSA